MHLDLRTLQIAAMIVVFALIYLARATKGRARQTSAGIAFPLKPLVIASRAIALPLYFLLFAYPLWISRQSIPAWLLLLIFVVSLFALFQLPGTIVLTPAAVVQRFWLRTSKLIPYTEIIGIAASPTGSVTRILGANRTAITHTFNHSASAEFRADLARLSGKQLNA